jgi:large exoprotein involved in heme utilization and adhesion
MDVGNGGNVYVDTRYIIAAPFNDNNISAQAGQFGGRIGFEADRLYDIEERVNVLVSNDIDASSDFGIDGIVTGNVLNVDPTQGLANLPANPVDPTQLIAETCAPRGGIAERQRNRFIVTGRGGLPPDPNAAFPGEAVVNDLGTPGEREESTTDDPNSTNPTSPAPAATASPQEPEIAQAATASPQEPEIAPATSTSPQESEMVEAQGWVYGENGDIIFTARASNGTVTPNNPALTPASTCNVSSTLPQ